MMVLDQKATQAMDEAAKSEPVEVIRGGHEGRWCLFWAGGSPCLGATLLSSLFPPGLCQFGLTLRAQGRTRKAALLPVPIGPTTPAQISTSRQRSSRLPCDFSMKVYLSLPTVVSDSNLCIPQLEFTQSFFFFNLKSWICLPDSAVCKGAGLVS